jgi:ABC-type branched-subunit amino acid transport system ATPase component
MAEALVIRNISKRFGGLRAVQDLDFSVGEGETVALIGPNGAGKTTSFNLITGFHRPDSGSVLAFGRELVGLRPNDVCTHGLARTFQVARPFGRMTVADVASRHRGLKFSGPSKTPRRADPSWCDSALAAFLSPSLAAMITHAPHRLARMQGGDS